MTNDISLFGTNEPLEFGLAFPNLGSGVMRYSYKNVIETTQRRFAQRCGHIPLNAKTIGIIAQDPDEATRAQIAYISQLYGKDIKILTIEEVKKYITDQPSSLIVPYITVPETERELQELNMPLWGLPGKMTHILKNKAEFYRLVDELDVEEFKIPEYTITYMNEVIPQTKKFLKKIEQMYSEAGVSSNYPIGVMLRSADEDASYGCSIMYEKDGYVIVIPNGATEKAKVYGNWDEALLTSRHILTTAMDPDREPRVVISRFIDLVDSPGMSVVIRNGNVYSLGWNGQIQKKGSKKAVGTSSYTPETPYLQKVQADHEEGTAKILEKFLRKTAAKCGIDFNTIQAVVNIDLIIPSDLEKKFQETQGRKPGFYYAECNPRWTNYTEAILTVIGAQRKEQTIGNMKAVIKEGIYTVDKYKLPENFDLATVREHIISADQKLQKNGTRLICRIAENPMGLILAGDVSLAEQEMDNIVNNFLAQQPQRPVKYLYSD